MRHVELEIDFYLRDDEDWANFIAIDVDGEVWAYEFAPEFNEDSGNWHSVVSGRTAYVGEISSELVPEWFGEAYWELGE